MGTNRVRHLFSLTSMSLIWTNLRWYNCNRSHPWCIDQPLLLQHSTFTTIKCFMTSILLCKLGLFCCFYLGTSVFLPLTPLKSYNYFAVCTMFIKQHLGNCRYNAERHDLRLGNCSPLSFDLSSSAHNTNLGENEKA